MDCKLNPYFLFWSYNRKTFKTIFMKTNYFFLSHFFFRFLLQETLPDKIFQVKITGRSGVDRLAPEQQ